MYVNIVLNITTEMWVDRKTPLYRATPLCASCHLCPPWLFLKIRQAGFLWPILQHTHLHRDSLCGQRDMYSQGIISLLWYHTFRTDNTTSSRCLFFPATRKGEYKRKGVRLKCRSLHCKHQGWRFTSPWFLGVMVLYSQVLTALICLPQHPQTHTLYPLLQGLYVDSNPGTQLCCRCSCAPHPVPTDPDLLPYPLLARCFLLKGLIQAPFDLELLQKSPTCPPPAHWGCHSYSQGSERCQTPRGRQLGGAPGV